MEKEVTKNSTAEHGANDRLRSLVDRIERLQEERKGLGDDIKDIYAEAKGQGYDVAVMKQVIKLRKMDAGARQERETLIDLYMRELGMLADTPLGQSAIARAS
jgi:uncharacterized protein (UPF0335 family)